METYEALAILAAIVAAMFTWWRCWSADRTMRLEMFREATKLAAVEDQNRSYMERIAGVYILTRLIARRFWLTRLWAGSGEYDDAVGILVGVFLKYRRLVFPMNAPVGHKVNQLDYHSKEYLLIRKWLNNHAPIRIVDRITFDDKHPFKICNGKLEANELSQDYSDWIAATGSPPYCRN